MKSAWASEPIVPGQTIDARTFSDWFGLASIKSTALLEYLFYLTFTNL